MPQAERDLAADQVLVLDNEDADGLGAMAWNPQPPRGWGDEKWLKLIRLQPVYRRKAADCCEMRASICPSRSADES